MSDNYDYEDDLFEDSEEKEQAEGKAKVNPDKMLRIIIIAVIIGLIVVVVLISMLLGSGSKKEEESNETINEGSVTLSDEDILTAPSGTENVGGTGDSTDKYEPGKYTVNVGSNGALTLRKEASKTSESILTIPNGTKLTITEVVFNSAAEEGLQYWGKTEYLGWEAWVSMFYLAKAYSDDIVTPGEVTTAPPVTETLTEAPTEAPTETPTQPPAEETPDNVYTVVVDGGGSLNLRAEPSSDAEKVIENGIPNGTKVTVLDTYENTQAEDSRVKYWAKVTYDGATGWVAMGYLEK